MAKAKKTVAPPAKPTTSRPAAKPAAPAAPATGKQARRAVPTPALDRARRQLPESERYEGGGIEPTELGEDRLTASARSGREELKQRLASHTETSPVMTAGDIDARWDDAYAVGDEAPGGDNPTPDQDRVDDIGKALGVVYQDGEELQGSDKVIERDRHRWELDPASSDDWPHNQD